MGMFESIGGFVNDILGGTTSAKTQHKYNKEFAQNAHQWEVKDLQKAGLNPAISAGGSSAGSIAGQSVGSSTNGNIGDLVNMGSNLISTLSQKKLNETTSAKTEAETNTLLTNLKYIPKEKQAMLNNMLVDKQLKEEEIEKIKLGKIAEYVGTSSKSTKKLHRMIDNGVNKFIGGMFNE